MYDNVKRPSEGRIVVFTCDEMIVMLAWDGWSVVMPIGSSMATVGHRMERFHELYEAAPTLGEKLMKAFEGPDDDPALKIASLLGLDARCFRIQRAAVCLN